MFSHIMVGSDDIDRSRSFYDKIFATLGIAPGNLDDKGRAIYASPTGVFAISKPINGDGATFGNGMTIGFRARSEDEVNAWHSAGISNGGTSCEDPPGYRTNKLGRAYLAYLRDPFGNKLCASFRPGAP